MKKRLFFSTVLVASAMSANALAYTFDEMCAPTTDHTPTNNVPRLGILLDQSDSMADDSSVMGLSKWDAALLVIDEVVNDYTSGGDDTAEFGVGVFGTGGNWLTAAQDDANPGLSSALSAEVLGGETNIGDGAQALEAENSLNTSAHDNFGVIIWDSPPDQGCPGLSSDARQQMVDAVNVLCAGQSRPNEIITYAIGFGADYDPGLNSMLAAAGGTGACCDSSDCANVGIDVCAIATATLEGYLADAMFAGCNTVTLAPTIQCNGGLDAPTNTDLKNHLGDIATSAVCTFELDIPAGYPGGAALPDPDATRVEMDHDTFSNPDIPLGYIGDCDAPMGTDTRDAIFTMSSYYAYADDYLNEGWCWATPARTRVRLTDKLCQDIVADDIDEVETQVSCSCALFGQSCTLTSLMCLQPDDTFGPCTNEQLMNMPCSDGVYDCVAGNDVCIPTGAAALYEICNGVDDNCDGRADNLDATIDDWPDPNVANGKHCNGTNTCNCPDGAKENVTYDGNINTALTTNWTGQCTCEGSLEPPSDDAPVVKNEEQNSAACAVKTANDQRGTFFIFVAVIAVLSVGRRRLLP